MVTKSCKAKARAKKPDKRFALTGVGEFDVPVEYKWTCEHGRVIFTTKNSYQGITSIVLPVDVLRDMLKQIDANESKIPPLPG